MNFLINQIKNKRRYVIKYALIMTQEQKFDPES